jgi:hypothetical protein
MRWANREGDCWPKDDLQTGGEWKIEVQGSLMVRVGVWVAAGGEI